MNTRRITLALAAVYATSNIALAQSVTITPTGGLKRWHAVTLTLRGPTAAEWDTTNPFLDHRMQVTFTHRKTKLRYVVPGYFAADGDAGNTSATRGDGWRAHLSPDHVGIWDYAISFRTGKNIAIDPNAAAGAALKPFDGVIGNFAVAESDKTGRDLRGKGRLRDVRRHHLRFANGEWFLKAGADSPENLLAYGDFDNTPSNGGHRKTWAPHVKDWRPGDPTWKTSRGKGLIGALNYLASEGLNAVSFLTYSFNGDDKNVFPYADPRVRTRMDCSKLDQWNRVFAHAGTMGLFLHFKTQEEENDQDHDGGALGIERKLYYRELIARFGHHLALNWNLGEENTNTTTQRRAFTAWFAALDPYDHPVVVHTFPHLKGQVYTPLLGSASKLAGASLQCKPNTVFADTLTWRDRSAAAGRPWVVANDEQGPPNDGIKPDAVDPKHDAARRNVIWAHFMAGGAGFECFFGMGHVHSDLTCQDFRSRDIWWDQCRAALELFGKHHVPFQDMANQDKLVDRGHCLAGAKYYVVYLATGGTAQLDLAGVSGSFTVRWYDPRVGGGLQTGTVTTLNGGGKRSLGSPPSRPTADWVVLMRPAGKPPKSQPYGRGCAGTGGRQPKMGSVGQPYLGNHAFAIEMRDGRPNATAALLAGTSRLAIPLAGGCSLYADGFGVGLFTGATGVARQPLPIPFDARLLGLSLFVTGAVVDPYGAFFRTLAIADGLELVVGY